jgi:hypothetical protein
MTVIQLHTPLLLQEKGMGDEVNYQEKGTGDEVNYQEKGIKGVSS